MKKILALLSVFSHSVCFAQGCNHGANTNMLCNPKSFSGRYFKKEGPFCLTEEMKEEITKNMKNNGVFRNFFCKPLAVRKMHPEIDKLDYSVRKLFSSYNYDRKKNSFGTPRNVLDGSFNYSASDYEALEKLNHRMRKLLLAELTIVHEKCIKNHEIFAKYAENLEEYYESFLKTFVGKDIAKKLEKYPAELAAFYKTLFMELAQKFLEELRVYIQCAQENLDLATEFFAEFGKKN